MDVSPGPGPGVEESPPHTPPHGNGAAPGNDGDVGNDNAAVTMRELLDALTLGAGVAAAMGDVDDGPANPDLMAALEGLGDVLAAVLGCDDHWDDDDDDDGDVGPGGRTINYDDLRSKQLYPGE